MSESILGGGCAARASIQNKSVILKTSQQEQSSKSRRQHRIGLVCGAPQHRSAAARANCVPSPGALWNTTHLLSCSAADGFPAHNQQHSQHHPAVQSVIGSRALHMQQLRSPPPPLNTAGSILSFALFHRIHPHVVRPIGLHQML